MLFISGSRSVYFNAPLIYTFSGQCLSDRSDFPNKLQESSQPPDFIFHTKVFAFTFPSIVHPNGVFRSSMQGASPYC